MSDLPPVLNDKPSPFQQNNPRGFFPRDQVRAIAFYIIALCIVASVVVCILAIWDFTKDDALWRLIASLIVVAGGTVLFVFVNGVFGDQRPD